jgi:hypothetical protein
MFQKKTKGFSSTKTIFMKGASFKKKKDSSNLIIKVHTSQKLESMLEILKKESLKEKESI